VAVGVTLPVLALVSYTGVQLARFERTDARRTMFVFAAPQPLTTGLNVARVDLAAMLGRLRYTEVPVTPTAPGQFRRTPVVWEIYLRANDPHDGGSPRLVRLELRGDRIARVTHNGNDVGAATLEPEILTSVGDRPGEAYRPVRLADVPPVLIQATFGLAAAIIAEGSLSFLGLGVEPPTASWGSMLNEGRQFLLVAPHLTTYPGLALMITVLGLNLVGDSLQDHLALRG